MIMNGLSQGGSSDSRIPVIYTTSYVGTGTYGQNNPNTLTFDFVPEFIWIYGLYDPSNISYNKVYLCNTAGGGSTSIFPMFVIEKLTTSYTVGQPTFLGQTGYDGASYVCYSKKSSDNKTIYWYSTVSAQANDKNKTYYVLALGYKEES